MSAHSQALRDRRKAAGQCPDCGGEPQPGRVRCLVCSMADSEGRLRRRHARQAAGVCPDCWQPIGTGPGQVAPDTWHGKATARCLLCSEASRRHNRERRAKRREAGKCTRCPLPSAPGRSLCPSCAKVQALSQHEARREQELRALGVCPVCGDRPEPGHAYCPAHMALRAGYSAAARERRKASGQCVQCSREAAPGRVRCVACLASNRARGVRRRAAIAQ